VHGGHFWQCEHEAHGEQGAHGDDDEETDVEQARLTAAA
jgi:hypothetical protein